MYKLIKRMFYFLFDNRGEVLNDTTLDNADGNQEGQELDADGKPIVKAAEQSVIDWESEANPYRKRYGDSQGQIQPLVRTLSQFAEYDHNTKQWKPKSVQAPVKVEDDVDRTFESFDPEFGKTIAGYTQKKIDAAIEKFRQESNFMAEYASQITETRSKTLAEFGDEFEFNKDGKFNEASPLYKLANEILHAKYAQFHPDGKFYKYISSEAEYMATVEAYAILAKRNKQPPAGNDKLNVIQGKGTRGGGVKRVLSFEEYSKLTNEQKDAYDLAQLG